MTDENGEPVPRDLPDQQAGEGLDPWDVDPAPEDEEQDDDVPDVDEAGSGRRGASQSATVHPEHPEPDESSA